MSIPASAGSPKPNPADRYEADATGYHHATKADGYMWLKMYQRRINPPGTPTAHARMYFITISRTGSSNLLAFGSHLPDPDQLPPHRADAEPDDQRGRSAGSRIPPRDRRIAAPALVVVAMDELLLAEGRISSVKDARVL